MRVGGIVALITFVGVCGGTLLSMQRREARLDAARPDADSQRVDLDVAVRTKVKVGRGLVFKPIRARTRALIGDGLVHIVPDEMRRNRLLGSEVIISTEGSTMEVRKMRFPLKRRECIVISGVQVGEPISVAIASHDDMVAIRKALQQAGVHEATSNPRP
jgi:hypothetical protein